MQAILSELFRVRIHGAGRKVVVLGHGFGTDQSSWAPVVASLVAAGYRAVTYDSAGTTGQTLGLYRAERHSSLFGFAEDLIALMGELGLEGAHYVGHSAGGMIGILAANGQPGLFSGLSLIGSSARYVDDPATGYVGGFSHGQIDNLIASMKSDYAAWANGFAQLVASNPDRPHLAVGFSRSLMALRPDIASAVLEMILRSDHRADAERVDLPTQVLQTGHDPAVPLPAARWLAETTEAVDFRVLAAEGHFPHISDPAQVGAALLEFLGNHARD
ncbi:MAG TPA: alpha/beta hydrolase [Rhodocyclaceae bacterium]|nr:alpha/beta hydrolase [Rhodocyclaceae bacterium]